ncbi:hypothetical protein [Herpetosiphon sp. NSE202]
MQQSKFWLLHEMTKLAPQYCTNVPVIQQRTHHQYHTSDNTINNQ